MSKKLLSLALVLTMCLGLTVPAFAGSTYDYSITYSFDGEEDFVYNCNYSANGYTDPAAENVEFSVAPIGVATIRWVFPDGTSEYTAYVFDQDCTVTRKDGLPFKSFGLPPMGGDIGYSVSMGTYEVWAHVEKEWAWVEAGSAGIRADRDDGWAFHFAPDTSEGESDWSPFMMSKKGLDTVFPYEKKEYGVTGTVLEYRPLSAQPTVSTVGGFTDVKTSDYFADPVLWAVGQGITVGTGDGTTFSPEDTCTNIQIITFLWRAAGRQGSDVTAPVSASLGGVEDYVNAANWAYENGIIGADFNPDAPCTRADTVNYMWKYDGSNMDVPASSFTDIPAGADYKTAVDWAVAEKVTEGTDPGVFSPDETCTRGQIVTFLYRGLAK